MTIVQARMSSNRFPGKSLYEVNGKPMLKYLLESIQLCMDLNDIVVATSEDPSDGAIEHFCLKNGFNCYRGDLNNVALRFKQVLDSIPCDAFVRLNGDSPLMDWRIVEKMTEIYLKGDFDLVTNVFPRSFPKGQSVEVLRTSTFEESYYFIRDMNELEHVTPFFYSHSSEFRIQNYRSEGDFSRWQLSVDTPDDMIGFEKLIRLMNRAHWEYSYKELLELAEIDEKSPVQKDGLGFSK